MAPFNKEVFRSVKFLADLRGANEVPRSNPMVTSPFMIRRKRKFANSSNTNMTPHSRIRPKVLDLMQDLRQRQWNQFSNSSPINNIRFTEFSNAIEFQERILTKLYSHQDAHIAHQYQNQTRENRNDLLFLMDRNYQSLTNKQDELYSLVRLSWNEILALKAEFRSFLESRVAESQSAGSALRSTFTPHLQTQGQGASIPNQGTEPTHEVSAQVSIRDSRGRGPTQNQNNIQGEDPIQNQYVCKNCGKNFPTKWNASRHERNNCKLKKIA